MLKTSPVSRNNQMYYFKLKILIEFALMILSVSVFAQNSTIKFQHLSIEDGLSQSVVKAIHQDSLGLLWIGTEEGLNKYDGYRFTVYQHDPQDTDSLNHDKIFAIYEDSAGTLWIGTEHGLNRYDRRLDKFESLSNHTVLAIYEDNNGILWIGTNGAGLNQFDRKTSQWVSYQHAPNNPESLSHNTVWFIYQDNAGTLWIGTDGGVNKFDYQSKKFTRYWINSKNLNNSSNSITSIYEDNTGTLWIGSVNGLHQFDRQQETFVHYFPDSQNPNSLSNRAVEAILEDNTGTLWVATDGGGLNQFDRKTNTFVHYQENPQNPASLNNNFLLSLYQDNAGTVWIGTGGGGVNYFNPGQKKFVYYSNDNDYNVFAFYKDKEGMLWIGIEWQTIWFRSALIILFFGIFIGIYRWRIHAFKVQNCRLEILVAERTEKLLQTNQALVAAKEKAEFANKAKSTFLLNASHELRNPLHVISSHTELFLKDSYLMAQRSKQIKAIHRNNKYLLTMINDILDLSKIEMDKIEIKPDTLHLPYFLQSLVEMMQIRAAFRQISFVYEASPDLPFKVKTDEKRLYQILLNLLTNAIKFTERGQVTLKVESTPNKREEGIDPLYTICFQVEDTGIGIPAEQIEPIFKPFHQGCCSPEFEMQGSGLGLPISQELVYLMGGKLRVNSKVDEGSTFWFELVLPAISNFSDSIEYEGNPETEELFASEPLIMPPREELLKLLEYAEIGNISDTQRLINKISEEQTYHPFVSKIKQWVDKYEFKQLIEFIKVNIE